MQEIYASSSSIKHPETWRISDVFRAPTPSFRSTLKFEQKFE
jgi:hypothetical protein